MAENIPAGNAANTIADPNQERMNKKMSDLPNFFGDSSKDLISPLAFMNRVDECKFNLKWSDEQTFNYFKMSMVGAANIWMDGIIGEMEDFRRSWEYIKPHFKKDFCGGFDYNAFLAKIHNSGLNNETFINYISRMQILVTMLDETTAGSVVANPPPQDQRTDEYLNTLLNLGISRGHKNFKNRLVIASMPEHLKQAFIQNNAVSDVPKQKAIARELVGTTKIRHVPSVAVIDTTNS